MNTNLLIARPFAVIAILVAGARNVGRWFWRCCERRRQRLVLAALDEHQLRDLGLTRGQSRIEAEKPFWR